MYMRGNLTDASSSTPQDPALGSANVESKYQSNYSKSSLTDVSSYAPQGFALGPTIANIFCQWSTFFVKDTDLWNITENDNCIEFTYLSNLLRRIKYYRILSKNLIGLNSILSKQILRNSNDGGWATKKIKQW